MVGRKWFIPWLWLSPALIILGIFLVYPTLGHVAPQFHEPQLDPVRGVKQLYVRADPADHTISNTQ